MLKSNHDIRAGIDSLSLQLKAIENFFAVRLTFFFAIQLKWSEFFFLDIRQISGEEIRHLRLFREQLFVHDEVGIVEEVAVEAERGVSRERLQEAASDAVALRDGPSLPVVMVTAAVAVVGRSQSFDHHTAVSESVVGVQVQFDERQLTRSGAGVVHFQTIKVLCWINARLKRIPYLPALSCRRHSLSFA